MRQSRVTGIPCPTCTKFVPITVETLLTRTRFTCPNPACRQVLHLDRHRSRESLREMKKFRTALETAERLKKSPG